MNKNIAQNGSTTITNDVQMTNCVISTKESVFFVEQARKTDYLSTFRPGFEPDLDRRSLDFGHREGKL